MGDMTLTAERLGQWLEEAQIDWRESATWKEKARIAERLGATVQAVHGAWNVLRRVRATEETAPEANGNASFPEGHFVFSDTSRVSQPAETLVRLARQIAAALLDLGVENVEPEALRQPLKELALVALTLRVQGEV